MPLKWFLTPLQPNLFLRQEVIGSIAVGESQGKVANQKCGRREQILIDGQTLKFEI